MVVLPHIGDAADCMLAGGNNRAIPKGALPVGGADATPAPSDAIMSWSPYLNQSAPPTWMPEV